LEPIEMNGAELGDSGLSEADMQRMSLEMETQLLAVREFEAVAVKKGLGEDELARKRMALYRQWELLEVETKEPTDSFLRKFGRVTRRDICEEGGLLNQQWQKYQDLSSSSTVQVVAGALAGLGVVNLPMAVVPVAVILTHLGLRTFCEEYGSPKELPSGHPSPKELPGSD
jgi:hypothetical protein